MLVQRLSLLAAIATALMLVLASCGDEEESGDGGNGSGDDTTSTAPAVVMKDTMKFEPPTMTVQPGERVTINLENDGSIKHNYSIDDADISKDLDAGESEEISFTAPSSPGEYKIYCDEPGHESAGMVGTLIVEQ